MKYGRIPGIKQDVSRAVLGSMIFSPENKTVTFDLLDEFVKLGGNCIDTAHVYGGGKSEAGIGLWLQERGAREKMVILDKGCHPYGTGPRVAPEFIRADLADNLARLNTTYVDMWVFHRDNPEVPVGPLVEELNTHIAAGKIRVLGASNWSHTRIQEFNEYAYKKSLHGFVLSSPHLSLAVPKEAMWAGSISVSPEAKQWHTEKQFPLFAWSSQARGFFSGRFAPGKLDGDPDVIRCYDTPENFERLKRAQELGKKKGISAIQVAFAYVMQQPFPTYCLIGPATLEELRSSVSALDVTLTDEEVRALIA
jgi:1-deoxyxylulose-5-phosphate synthase